MNALVATSRRGFPNCEKCQLGYFEHCYRLSVKHSVEAKPVLTHVHHDEVFADILERLCQDYSDLWKEDTRYYFYVDMGGLYHEVESPSWLRDKDSVIITIVPDLAELPKINLNAVHASLRDNVELRPHQVEGVNTMIYMEKAYRGGILADEMGLGKTVQTLAVILRQQPVLKTHACTLVVVPSRGIADQWAEEIRTKTTYGSLPYFIYQDDSVALLEQPCFRVVITTYDRVRAEFKKNEFNLRNIQNHGNNDTTAPTPTIEDAPLFDVEWQRIVLDESHKVRGGTMLFHSVNALKAKFKWCLSGTPFQNDTTELYPIFTFLNIEMDLKKRREDEYMTELLKTHMIRRTKAALQTELTILPRQERRIVLEFSKPERALYDYLERLLYHQLTKMKELKECNSLLTSSAILYLRLKQVCGHHMILLDKFPDLIPLAKSGRDNAIVSNFQDSEVSREKNYYDETSEFEEALEIIGSYYDQFGNLQDPIDLSLLQKLKFMKHSTKVTWLVKFLKELLNTDTSEKIIVVSQFVDVIMKVGEILTNTRIPFQTYHGGMSIYSRKCALRKFNHDPKIRVLIMSLKAGGVGLNLQRANHMIIMDRWWNPATMDQAIARIHRMTQLKETYIHTVVIKDSIEESLMDNILNKKNALFQKIVERHEMMIENHDSSNNNMISSSTEQKEQDENDMSLIRDVGEEEKKQIIMDQDESENNNDNDDDDDGFHDSEIDEFDFEYINSINNSNNIITRIEKDEEEEDQEQEQRHFKNELHFKQEELLKSLNDYQEEHTTKKSLITKRKRPLEDTKENKNSSSSSSSTTIKKKNMISS